MCDKSWYFCLSGKKTLKHIRLYNLSLVRYSVSTLTNRKVLSSYQLCHKQYIVTSSLSNMTRSMMTGAFYMEPEYVSQRDRLHLAIKKQFVYCLQVEDVIHKVYSDYKG